ncbi:MAG: PilZ domain-containing protein [Deltaproteobacteria bacterium]|nr:PilZ domain-containing protein [Deltaproteobacteria bacterium]
MSVEKERRSAGGRIPIKTLVEIGAGEGGAAAFEAESVDVNPSGMHLRTAYLPEVGEPLICRFEANGREITVQGEVAWRNEEACGGDFGVRFLEVDDEALQALRDIAGEAATEEASAEESDEPQPVVQRGTRMRLHIDGLASPMKARVREASTSEIMVGSNLEFLKVGRPLDLENIDAGDKRGARIERVNIEVDPQTKIPQLVVALRYLDAPEDDEVVEAAPRRSEPATRMADSQQDAEEESEEDLARKAGKPEALWNRIKQYGPTLAQFGGKAKSVVNLAIDKAKSYRAKSDEDGPSAPKRVTSPAPSGGLRSGGRKGVVRDEPSDDVEPATGGGLKKVPKKALVIGAASLVLLITVFAIARKPSAPPGTAAAPVDGSASTASITADSPPNAPNGPMVANVPLFGPTPMTTNEPAALPAAQGTAAATPPPGDKLAAAAADKAEGSEDGDSSGDDASSDDGDKDKGDGKGSSAPAAKGSKSFVHGKVKNPVVLSFHVNGPVKSIKGMPTATGFTVHIAGSQTKDSVAGLAHKDPRIASIKLNNKGNGSDLTVQFKDGVPAYAVRGSGSSVSIAIGRSSADKSEDKKTAKAPKHHARKGGKHGKK